MPVRYAREVGCRHVGQRVSVRYAIGTRTATDAVGTLEACDGRSFAVRTRRGELVRIDRATVVASRLVKPPASRSTHRGLGRTGESSAL